MPRTKQFDKQETLERAMELFWKNGFHATSIQDLVDFLKVNRASLYNTFGGKDELFDAAFAEYLKRNTQAVKSMLAQESDVRKGFELLFRTAIEQAHSDTDNKGCFVVNTTTELIPEKKEFAQILDQNRHTFESVFYDYLKQGQKAGQISEGKDLKALSALLFTLFNGLRVVSKTGVSRDEQFKVVDQALSLLNG